MFLKLHRFKKQKKEKEKERRNIWQAVVWRTCVQPIHLRILALTLAIDPGPTRPAIWNPVVVQYTQDCFPLQHSLAPEGSIPPITSCPCLLGHKTGFQVTFKFYMIQGVALQWQLYRYPLLNGKYIPQTLVTYADKLQWYFYNHYTSLPCTWSHHNYTLGHLRLHGLSFFCLKKLID